MEDVRAPIFDGTQLCGQVNPEIFFPHPKDVVGIRNAKKICSECKFSIECLEYALWEPSLEGIWGGTTPRQRESLRTRARRNKVLT